MTEVPWFRGRTVDGGIRREYRVYASRLEFDTTLGTLVVPFDEIERLTELPERERRADDPGPETLLIERSHGAFRRVILRTDRPLRQALDDALRRYREGRGDC